jgi:hypothetical protein
MKITIYKMKRVFFCITIALTFFACEQGSVVEDEVIIIEEQENKPLDILTNNELEFITNLLKVEQYTDVMWPSFNGLRDIPIYIITGENKGIYINSVPSIEFLNTPIEHDIQGFRDIELYRNDLMHQFAVSHVPPDQLWNWPIYEGRDMFVLNLNYEVPDNFYYQYKNRNGYFHVAAFWHELHHVYGFNVGEQYYGIGNYIQDLDGLFLTSETMPYILLLYDVMIDAYHVSDQESKRKLLEYYVSIYDKLLELDATEDNLIRKHGLYLEKREGVARYIEVFGTLNSLGNNTIEDPTHGYQNVGENAIRKQDVIDVYSFRIFYHTGAGAVYLLNSLGYENLDQDFLIPTNTSYDLARDFVDLSQEELENVLENAKEEYQWSDIEERAAYLASLL